MDAKQWFLWTAFRIAESRGRRQPKGSRGLFSGFPGLGTLRQPLRSISKSMKFCGYVEVTFIYLVQ